MCNVRILAALIVLLVLPASAASDKHAPPSNRLEDWLPVTQQDLDVKDIPGNPGAPAIQLYYSYYKDDDAHFEFEYRRIKILHEAGRRYADVEIPIDPGDSLLELKARTIRPDGTIVDFKDKPFEKTLHKSRGVKISAEVFTFPEADIGCILEYRYKIDLPEFFFSSISTWKIQSELFTVKARFRYRAFQGAVEVPVKWSTTGKTAHSQVSMSYINQVDPTVPEKKSGNLMEMELQGIPAFEAEEYMPPEYDYEPLVLFYYGGKEIASPEQFWQALGKYWAQSAEKFIGDFREIRELASQVIGNEGDPEKKLRKLFFRAQQIRNLSYERTRTKVEEKKEELKENHSAVDVLNHGFGTSDDIDMFFAALARAGGFDAHIIQVSDRLHLSFSKMVLFPGQLDAKAVMVRVGGKDVVLDPGTEGCPYGMVPWKHTAVVALKLGATGAEFISTPPPEIASMRRTARLALTPDGSLKGDLTVEFLGQDALEHRIDALKTDEAGKRKNFEDEVQSWLPTGAIVKYQDSTGWNNPDEPLIARLTLEIPGFAAVTPKRLAVPAFFFPTLRKDVFTRENRKYPIVLPYPFVESDEITMKLPDGYSLESPPYRRKAGLSFAGYEISSSIQDNQLITKRSLRVQGLIVVPEEYDTMKNFFTVVHAGDGGLAVFNPQETTTVEKKE